jgi:signal transduction histidine kinase
MNEMRRIFSGLPQSTLRQWRSTPTYIFLIWRWGTWLFALLWYLNLPKATVPYVTPIMPICLALTFVYSLITTFYAPVSRVLFIQFSGRPKRGRKAQRSGGKNNRQLLDTREEARIISPLIDTHNHAWNIAIYGFDVLFCGLIMYFSAANESAPFGEASPFYRFGLSAILVAGFTYSYRGGLLAALGYSLFAILGAFIYPPGQNTSAFFYDRADHLGIDLIGSLIDAPIVAMLAAYLANQLNKAILSKRQVQEHDRRERALRGVSEILVMGSSNQVELLRRSVKAIRQGGRFEKLVIALVRNEKGKEPRPDFDTYVETDVAAESLPDVSEELVSLVAKTGRKHASFDSLSETLDTSLYGIARLYLPFFKDGKVYLVIGAERLRTTPFSERQEEFLQTVGPQLIVALENIRLTAETATLATLAERGRIAREIHDGIAQLLYMLSLNSETGLALVERIASGTKENGNEALTSLKEALEKQVAISKQALWETRHYMFTLQPLINGNTTLAQMLTTQLHEFEAISGLKTYLKIEGQAEAFGGDAQRNQRRLQVGTALFRITQEALTNAYKHAQASQVEVALHYAPEHISVEISDNGRGMPGVEKTSDVEKIYSGRGLRGMRERAAELGGILEIRPGATGGTCVAASIPL